jgi:hypothetical protein
MFVRFLGGVNAILLAGWLDHAAPTSINFCPVVRTGSGVTVGPTLRGGPHLRVEPTRFEKKPTFGFELRLGAGNPVDSHQAFCPCRQTTPDELAKLVIGPSNGPG